MKQIKTQYKRVFAALTLLCTVGLANTASARDGGHCRHAIQRLNEAQDYFQKMQYMVYNNSLYCPGGWDTNAACMMTIANAYNESMRNLRRAQHEYNRACHGRW